MKRGDFYRVHKGDKYDPFVSHLSDTKMEEVNTALRIALAIE